MICVGIYANCLHGLILILIIWLYHYSDILLGLMKRLIKDRASDLKVLITSATLDGLRVSKFFSGCPVLNIPGTLFPVEKFYSTERPTNYIESSLRTAIGKKHFFVTFCSFKLLGFVHANIVSASFSCFRFALVRNLIIIANKVIEIIFLTKVTACFVMWHE